MLAASERSLKPGVAGRTLVHRLPQATRVRRHGGDSQSHRDKHTHQQQNQQQSGDQTMHELQILHRRADEKWVSAYEKQFTTVYENKRHVIVKSG
jgi:hypothetical protein